MENTTKPLSKFQKTILYFIIYAFMGWVCEEILCVVTTHEFLKRGFLFGPICPIYGYGALILILFFKDYKKRPIRLFFSAAIIFSLFEYITDFFLQALFANRWWDYTGQFLNLNGRITLSFSIVWGIRSIDIYKYNTTISNKSSCKNTEKNPSKHTKNYCKYTFTNSNCRYSNFFNKIFKYILEYSTYTKSISNL